MKTYTVFVDYPYDSVEEIDVQAKNGEDAIAKARVILNKMYQPGWRIRGAVLRTGLYF